MLTWERASLVDQEFALHVLTVFLAEVLMTLRQSYHSDFGEIELLLQQLRGAGRPK